MTDLSQRCNYTNDVITKEHRNVASDYQTAERFGSWLKPFVSQMLTLLEVVTQNS